MRKKRSLSRKMKRPATSMAVSLPPGNSDWCPTWDDYADVVVAMTEDEVMTFIAKTVHACSSPALVITRHTARALCRAALIGAQPGWRTALRESFGWIDRKEIAKALQALDSALCTGRTPLNPKYGILIRRSLVACRRLGFPIPASDAPTIGAPPKSGLRS